MCASGSGYECECGRESMTDWTSLEPRPSGMLSAYYSTQSGYGSRLEHMSANVR